MAERVTGADRARSINLTINIDGARETLKAFRDLPKDASNELRDAAMGLSNDLAGFVRSAGMARGGQAARVAGTVKPRRDRVPYFVVGGTARIATGQSDGSKREAFRILFGSEFGATKGASRTGPNGFTQHAGRRGLWIFPTVEAHQGDIAKAWHDAADEIVDQFCSGGTTSEVIG
jgi:hypothetical protein